MVALNSAILAMTEYVMVTFWLKTACKTKEEKNHIDLHKYNFQWDNKDR